MNSVYTIICSFSLSESDPLNECWIVNLANREDAVRAFQFKMNECGALQIGNMVVVDGERLTAEKLFDQLLTTGRCYETYNGIALNRWFVRCEKVYDTYDEDAVSFA